MLGSEALDSTGLQQEMESLTLEAARQVEEEEKEDMLKL